MTTSLKTGETKNNRMKKKKIVINTPEASTAHSMAPVKFPVIGAMLW